LRLNVLEPILIWFWIQENGVWPHFVSVLLILGSVTQFFFQNRKNSPAKRKKERNKWATPMSTVIAIIFGSTDSIKQW
jgi:hypothetical protein